jgi:hypothetical protein
MATGTHADIRALTCNLVERVVDVDFWKLLTVLVAVFAVWIAFQQYQVARNKIKLDLFEKRFSVFVGTRKFLSLVLQKGDVALDDLFSYRASIAEADFLFEEELVKYLWQIDSRALGLHTTTETMRPLPVSDERSRLAQRWADEIGWLTGQLPELKKQFGPYMSFRKWK